MTAVARGAVGAAAVVEEAAAKDVGVKQAVNRNTVEAVKPLTFTDSRMCVLS